MRDQAGLGAKEKEYRTALRTIRHLLDYDAFLFAHHSASPGTDVAPAVDRETLLDLVRTSPGRVLGYAATETILTAYGIPLAPAWLVRSSTEACAAARVLGLPVALKVASPDVPHKSDVGALALGLGTEAEVAAAYDRILASVRQAAPDAQVEGVLVQPMIDGVAETIVGVSDDPQLGPLTMFGMGGIFVEVMRDVAFRVGRLSVTEARGMLDDVRGAALLRGARGRSLADEDALVDVLWRISHLAADLRAELVELDLNPLVVLPAGQGAVVVDALLVRRER